MTSFLQPLFQAVSQAKNEQEMRDRTIFTAQTASISGSLGDKLRETR